jgi:pilus assembly protein TadC
VKVRLLAIAAGAAAAVVVGGWFGAVLGVVVVAVLWRALPDLAATRVAADHRRAAADLPLAADLMAAALRAGAPPDLAARTVGESLDGPLGERLVRVANALRLGEPPSRAWEYLSELPGGQRLSKAAARSADSGAALATAFCRHAEELRAARVAAADARARRAGVLVVLPLGLCFLPAFLLTGVVPVVVAVLDGAFG